jgi:hypothetical protein
MVHDLITALRHNADRLRDDWRHAAAVLAAWSTSSGPARARVTTYLRDLPVESQVAVATRSRETATHYAWCVHDMPTEPFSLWINEYKLAGRWPPTYANSVHNHRYDFCTRVLAGGYVHERYRVGWDHDSGRLVSVSLHDRCGLGEDDMLIVPADVYHRIPAAHDGTLTLLVKARPRFRQSFSYDPTKHTTQIHIPIEARFDALVDALGRY